MRYESGRQPPAAVLQKIADYGGVTVKWLLTGKEEGPAEAAREHVPESYSVSLPDLNTQLLADAILRVEETVKAHRLKMTPDRKARLIAKVYDDCKAAHERPSRLHVEKILLLVD